jgi:hypothetical protein
MGTSRNAQISGVKGILGMACRELGAGRGGAGWLKKMRMAVELLLLLLLES